MFHTAEMRWFLEGRPPPIVSNWFADSSLHREEDPRIDTYLVLPGCTTCGVKIRQGHFEVKAQTSPPEPVVYDNGITGRRSAWVKWSSGLAGAQLLQEQQGPETWIQVEKARALRLFALSDRIEEQPATEWLPGAGCTVELAQVRVADAGGDWSKANNWWSVCLEAFGEAEQVLGHLDKVASSGILRPIGGLLPGEASLSYPDWFSRCRADHVKI